MEKLFISALTLLLTLALVQSSYGLEQTEPSSDQGQVPVMTMDEESAVLQQEDRYQTAMEFEGLPAVFLTGEEIGRMQSITTDNESGLIHFFTMIQTNEAGEEREINVPYGALRFYNDRAVLIVEQDTLDSAPAQVELSDAEYQQNLQSHYGIAPVWDDNARE